MARPRLLLIPEFTEVQWTIRPLLEEWGEVRSYEPFGETLKQLDCPMLLAQHEGCLISTEEGFEEAVRSLRNAGSLQGLCGVPRK